MRPFAQQLADAIPRGATVAAAGAEEMVWNDVVREQGLRVPSTGGVADYRVFLFPTLDGAAQIGAARDAAATVWVVAWSRNCASRHELLLRQVLRQLGVEGEEPEREFWSAPPSLPGQWTWSTLQDVARFDSAADFWAVMVGDRPGLAAEVARLGDEAVTEGIGHCNRELAPYTAADMTIRLPIEALWFQSAGSVAV